MQFKNDLNSPAQYVKGVGPRIAKLLGRLGVNTVLDMIYFFPRSYVDRRNIVPISKVEPGEVALIKGGVTKVKVNKTRRGFTIIKAAVMDRSGIIYAVWFNQPFMQNVLKRGVKILVSGKADFNSYTAEMELSVREYEILGDDGGVVDPIVPNYPLTAGLQQKKIRNIIKLVISSHLSLIVDPLPEKIKAGAGLMELLPAIRDLHFPGDLKDISPSHRRLAFDDFFSFQVGMMLRRKIFREEVKGIKFEVKGELLGKLTSSLPFELTNAQKKVFKEISSDMSASKPMARLLQGDVGSGKTVVAAMAITVAMQSGHQAALMVPTEILAGQHYSRLKKFFDPLGVNVELLISSVKSSERKGIKERLRRGEINMVVGTHALLEEDVKFKNLGLVVIDEQHRFGVLQRASLSKKGGNPDILVMTATPIPRSLALTLYGDLDRSVIDELPPGRTPVKTVLVSDSNRSKAYEFIRKEVSNGRQAFVICPLIEESEALDLKAAKLEAETLGRDVFPEFEVGLLHGRLKGDEKDSIMKRYRDGKINILVSTTVVEVGIDIPNATIMLIEHAERFGLAQMHQLRGRIGRGAKQSYCLIAGDPKSEWGKARIAAMLSSNDGFKIAEEDLKIRGPGDFYGVAQAGLPVRQAGLPLFRIADIIADSDILLAARNAAVELVESDPKLEREENRLLREELNSRYGKFLELGMLN
jgi:ATP-dependent DNA helicase RecG